MLPARSPRFFGIVNITTDSFSDGGRYLAPERAIAHAESLLTAGAHVIDLGPASSNPASTPVGADEEIRRLAPVLDALLARDVAVSVDSFEPTTQRYALERGVAFLNDITGFRQPALYSELARSRARLVIMHSVQGEGPATVVDVEPDTIWTRLFAFFDHRIDALVRAGVDRQRLILDPGMGFFLGSRPEVSLRVLAHVDRLRERYDLEVMISVSRKSFLRRLTGREAMTVGAATLAAELRAIDLGVDWVRTHDVAALADACTVSRAIENARRVEGDAS